MLREVKDAALLFTWCDLANTLNGVSQMHPLEGTWRVLWVACVSSGEVFWHGDECRLMGDSGQLTGLNVMLFGEVIVMNRPLRAHAGGSQSFEQSSEAAGRRVCAVAAGPIAGIQQCDLDGRLASQEAGPAGLSRTGRPAACQSLIPPRR